MSLRFCNTCCETKPMGDFRKYGNECSKCKEERNNKQKQKYYKNRTRCICGLYISDANPMEKHEKTNSHQNFIKYGTRNSDEYDYVCTNGNEQQRLKMNVAIMNSDEDWRKLKQ